MQKVLGILNGDLGDDQRIQAWLQEASFVIAADGAASRCIRLGRPPDVTIGDFDSFAGSRDSLPRTVVVEDQNFTDCDKLLKFASDEGAGMIALAGIEGTLPDHFLASLLSCTRFPGMVQLVFDQGIGWILKPGDTIEASAEGRVSLLPLSPCIASLSGVKWPFEDTGLESGGLVSISNHGLGPIKASVKSGYAFLFTAQAGPPQWHPTL